VNNTSPQHMNTNAAVIFAQLSQQDVEEFFNGYQYWNLQHQIEILQYSLNDVRKQITENTARIQELQPTAIELATLARLQSNGVSDVNLLDRMLERGESWLDRTMQRLDYLEQLDDFISDDYTQWCQHALEGAYDWIDSVLDGNASSQPSTATTLDTTGDMKVEELLEVTEELFFQKISIDEDEAIMQDITMKRPSITPANLEEVVRASEDTHAEHEEPRTHANSIATLEEACTPDISEYTNEMQTDIEVYATNENDTDVKDDANQVDTNASKNEDDTQIESAGPEGHLAIEDSATSTQEPPPLQEPVEIAPFAQTSSSPHTDSTFEHVTHKRPGFMKRFLGKVWGS
jgi:hypothetical protein